MQAINITQCPYCQSTNIGTGYQLGGGSIFADEFAYHSSYACSTVVYLICKDCGSILYSKVTKPEVFRQSSLVRQEELLDFINLNGILLCNTNAELPSLSSLGYNWGNLTGLIDLHEIFYCKTFKKRSTYLSREAYLLLRKCKPKKAMDLNSNQIYELLKSLETAEKEELKLKSGMETKIFDKAFDFLLENLYITAFINGKYLNPNWSTFVYSTSERWEKEVTKLHFHGDPIPKLEAILLRNMQEKDFIKLIR
jgi:hypothetical protein